MKNIFVFTLALALLLALCACGANGSATQAPAPAATAGVTETAPAPAAQTESPETAPLETLDASGGGVLVVYFSHTGENYAVGTIDKGNTAIIADMIAEAADADTFEIVPVTPYPDNYNECLEVAAQEQRSNARPEYVGEVEDWQNYGTVFFGYPIWWGDLPMIAYSFLENHDWNDKTVIPFNTHEGSGQSGTQRTIEGLCSGATVLQGLAMRGSTAQNLTGDGTDATVKNWLDGLGLVK